MYVSFIDYSAAFDSVSHKFIDKALKAAGASHKSRALFRAIYKAASATTRVQSTDGSEVMSAPFPIDRGVVQGDITSPLYFILALELILRKHDSNRNKGVRFRNTTVDTLGYADDAALLDDDINVSTTRVTSIASGSKLDADMVISVDKTEVMHVEEQGRVAQATIEELQAACTFKCPHIGCERVFHNAHGCKCHAGKCRRKNWYEVEKILDVQGGTGSPDRKFLIRLKGYGPEDDLWEPRNNIHPDLINDYLLANNLYDHAWPGSRCPWCDKPCKNVAGVRTHMRWCNFKPDTQNFTGTCAEKAVKTRKLIAAQRHKQTVLCEGAALKNTYKFKYLGSIFSADGSNEHDVKRRIALATQRMGTLRHVFNSDIPLTLKLQIYKSAICSLLTYGCEAWTLHEKTLASINGANTRCLSWFTGKDAHTEASVRTRTYDLVHAIRVRRFRWLDHILRLQGDRLIKLAVAQQYEQGLPGNMFYDVPPHLSFEQIQTAASDRVLWKRLETLIRPHSSDTAGAEKKLQVHKMSLLLPASSSSSLTPLRRPGAITRAVARANPIVVSPPAANSIKSPRQPNGPKRYCARDHHELFFRPAKTRADRQPKTKKKSRTVPLLTDKQRAAEAHAHFILHHGSELDAARFLQANARARSISTMTTTALKQMCPGMTDKASVAAPTINRGKWVGAGVDRFWVPAASVTTSASAPTTPQTSAPHKMTTMSLSQTPVLTIPPIPTWDEANAVVFDSSSEVSLSPPSPPETPAVAKIPPIPKHGGRQLQLSLAVAAKRRA